MEFCFGRYFPKETREKISTSSIAKHQTNTQTRIYTATPQNHKTTHLVRVVQGGTGLQQQPQAVRVTVSARTEERRVSVLRVWCSIGHSDIQNIEAYSCIHHSKRLIPSCTIKYRDAFMHTSFQEVDGFSSSSGKRRHSQTKQTDTYTRTLFLASLSAPASRSSRTQSVRPWRAEPISAVEPSCYRHQAE